MDRAIQSVVGTVAVTAMFVLAPGVMFGQSAPNEPIKTTLCDLAKMPDEFNGKMAQFRADFVSKFQWQGFVDAGCSAKLQIGVSHPLDDLKPQEGEYAFTTVADDNTHPERLNWKPILRTPPVRLKQDDNYKAFRRYAETIFKWPDGGTCLDCPLYRITVTATGRFDHFETDTVAVRANPTTKAVHISGFPDEPLSRLVLASVSDVSATPIDPSMYSQAKRRNISLEEANDLVFACLRSVGCTKQTCSLVRYHAADWPGLPEFYSFQAISSNPHTSFNQGYYEVDPRSGDVWNGVICERFESPFLVGLQRTIRKRIGLHDDEYKNASQDGPMCGEGMPRVGRGK